jgi:hypothetical protein
LNRRSILDIERIEQILHRGEGGGQLLGQQDAVQAGHALEHQNRGLETFGPEEHPAHHHGEEGHGAAKPKAP